MAKQPLNEAYSNEVLESVQYMCDIYEECKDMMIERIPFEKWPNHLKRAVEKFI